ncbi:MULTISPECIES: hypothetical protein [Paenibacillus]|uniref:hypothetical protein n=1 Tax=Paenibacillus TaxID=44249 RepID=UPI000B83A52E|nr:MULTISPECIES: hypothetical protein [Paenibacillus]
MKNRFIFFYIALLVVLLLTACKETTTSDQTVNHNPSEKPSSTLETTPEIDSSTNPTTTELPQTKPDVKFKLPYTIDSITIKNDILERNTIVSSYKNDNDIVIFSRDFSTTDEMEMEIIQFDTKKNTYVSQYRAAKGMIINTLVSVGDDLFWVENPSHSPDNNTPWKMMRMKRDDLEASPTIFTEGISEDQIAVPVLRTYQDEISWIEKKINNKIVKNEAFIYNVKSNIKTNVTTQLLNEKTKNKKGIFLDLQRPVNEGLLIQQTVFGDKDPNTEKRFDIVMYPKDHSEPELIIKDREDIYDFTANEQWIVLTTESATEILDRNTKKLIYTIVHDSSLLGGYSPFLLENQLIYKQSPYIMAVDLTTGHKQRVINKEGSYTSIYNFGDILTFTRMEYEKDRTQAELFFIHLNARDQ